LTMASVGILPFGVGQAVAVRPQRLPELVGFLIMYSRPRACASKLLQML
jgi:hypothetical protein